MVFAVSQAISNFGDKLDYMALLAMVAVLAERNQWQSARANSFLLVIGTLPVILFGPLAGALVDRWNRKHVLVVCDTLRAILVVSIPVLALRTQSLPLVFLIAFVVFLLGMFFNTARLAIIPNLVATSQLLEANSLLALIGRGATFAGMLLGGLIVDWPGWRRLGIRETWSAGFYVDSLTFVISAVTLGAMSIQLAVRPVEPNARFLAVARSRLHSFVAALDRRLGDLHQDLVEAYRLMRRSPAVRLVLASIVLFVVLGAAVVVLLIPIVQTIRDDLRLGVGTRVGLVGAAGSAGLVASSLLYGLLGRRLRKGYAILGGFVVLGVLTVVIALVQSLGLMLGVAFFAGLLLAPIGIAQDTLIH
ncbi:MAG: MFS transporter [candidate division WOR-3 bacterium]